MGRRVHPVVHHGADSCLPLRQVFSYAVLPRAIAGNAEVSGVPNAIDRISAAWIGMREEIITAHLLGVELRRVIEQRIEGQCIEPGIRAFGIDARKHVLSHGIQCRRLCAGGDRSGTL